jgi:uncharacterized membrane protein
LVVPLGWVTVFPLPVAESTTVAPLIAFPLASLAVTVIVDASLPAPMDTGAAATVDCEADTGPAVTVTFAVCVIAIPSAVAEAVFDPATAERRVPVATPLASVGPTGWVNVLPVPVAASTTVAPLIGVPLAFFTVTVIVAIPLSAVIEEGEAATLDCDADTAGGVTVTVTVCVTVVPSIVAEMVFGSATLELSVPLATPLALVGPPG